jgi:spore coat protein U-like protein
MWRARLLLSLAVGLGLATPAAACTISSAGVAFGAYNPRATGADNSSGTITVVCASTVTAPVVQLSTGQSGTYSARRMTSGGWNLNYNLFTNSARTTIWGNGTGGSVSQTLSGGTVSGGQRTFTRTVFGRIPALQNVGAGSYGDTITLTVVF